MRTFVIPDIHGRPEQLRRLLRKAGCIDDDGKRVAELFSPSLDGEKFQVISIGDLANGTLEDCNADEECLLHVSRDHWIDWLILGNHESGYIFDGLGFNGFNPVPPVQSLYRSLESSGLVVPTMRVGETLLTHAGVQAYFNFASTKEAHAAIWDTWQDYSELRHDYTIKFVWGETEIPKALLLDGVPASRGGNIPMGGILWSDWSEQKNTNFSQVVGHSPRPGLGPIEHRNHGNRTFHLNIDCGAKSGEDAIGVWLDADGQIIEFVAVS